jgi:hypothetical protein
MNSQVLLASEESRSSLEPGTVVYIYPTGGLEVEFFTA